MCRKSAIEEEETWAVPVSLNKSLPLSSFLSGDAFFGNMRLCLLTAWCFMALRNSQLKPDLWLIETSA